MFYDLETEIKQINSSNIFISKEITRRDTKALQTHSPSPSHSLLEDQVLLNPFSNSIFDDNNIYDNNNIFQKNELNEFKFSHPNINNIHPIERENGQSDNIKKNINLNKTESENEPKKEKKELNEPEFETKPKKEEKTLLGRKKGNDKSEREHDKYKEDNMSRKIKILFKNDLLEFINNKIKYSYFSAEINNELYKGEKAILLNINDKKYKNINVDYNLKLFNTKIRYILNDTISGKYKKYPNNYNDEIIKNIYKSEKGEDVRKILDKTFLECLKYYRMDENIYGNDEYACLSGLEKGFQKLRNELLKDNKNDEHYADELIKFMKNYEEIYYSKKPRSRKKKEK
jgi:hypothetical protein